MKRLKIGLVQMKVLLAQPDANRRKVKELVQKAVEEKCDVVVLPEMWNIGFFPKKHLQVLAETGGGESRALLSELAAACHVNLVGGSLAIRRENAIYNTAYVFDREGKELIQYDKIHGFSCSGEDRYFQQGSKLAFFHLEGIPAGLMICYDLRFTELARSLALLGAELLFIPAQWPFPRQEHWQILNRARAIENQLYVASVNGCGEGEGVSFCGQSMLIDPSGNVLLHGTGQEEILCGEMDFSEVEKVRNSIPVFRDRKPLVYQIT